MDKWNKDNILGAEFETGDRFYIIRSIKGNDVTIGYKGKSTDSDFTCWKVEEVVKKFNSSNWQPLTEPINTQQELVFELY